MRRSEENPPGVDALSDEELIAELYRRFGEGWCSFSAMVREREVCPTCDRRVDLTRHHLEPVAQGGGKKLAIRRRYVDICRDCHDRAHQVFGPGHRWEGPTEREIFLKELTTIVGLKTRPEEDQSSKRRSKPRMRRFFSRLLSFRRRS